MFGGGITISEKLWAFAFHIILFHVLASVIGAMLILSLIRIFVKPKIACSNPKPFKLQAPQFVMIE